MMPARQEIVDVYVRVCKDSGFGLDLVQAAQLTAAVLDIHQLQVWIAIDTDNMRRLADGTHGYYQRA